VNIKSKTATDKSNNTISFITNNSIRFRLYIPNYSSYLDAGLRSRASVT